MGQLNDAIRDAEQSTTGWIVIDLAELSFMDSTIPKRAARGTETGE